MRKYLLGLITVIAIMLAMPITAFAASDNVKIIDDAGLLSSEETNELEAYLEGLDSSVNYLAVTCEDRVYGNTAREKLDNYYRNYFDAYEDGIAFIIDMDNREIYMQGRNAYMLRVTDGDCVDITDNIYKYASKADYYNCFYQAFRQADMVANYKMVLRPMRVLVSFFIAIILGFLGCFLKAMYDRSEQNEIKGASEVFLVNATFKGLANVYDTKKRRVREQHYSSGGHSSGGGFSGGGFSSGGGGFSSGGGGGGGFSGGGHSF